MKIKYKLLAGFIGIVSLLAIGTFYSISRNQKALEKAIGESSVMLTEETLKNIDRTISDQVEYWSYISEKSQLLHDILYESNLKFEKLVDYHEYIAKKEKEWTSARDDEITPFMKELINSKLSRQLRARSDFIEKQHGYPVFGEVFVTNKYGANVAQTGKTSDYFQEDKEWWKKTKQDKLTVSDVNYDESSHMTSLDICLRVDDEQGNFQGILKVVLNIKHTLDIIEDLRQSDYYLLTKDGRVIYATDEKVEYKAFHDLSHAEFVKRIRMHENTEAQYFLSAGVHTEEGQYLYAYAFSKGNHHFRGLGWILVVKHKTEDIFALVIELRDITLIVIATAITIAVLLSFFISHSVSDSITKLKDSASEIGKGNLDVKIDIQSRDEIGDLANTFNKMAEDLKKSTTSIKELNREITVRHQTEEELHRLRNYLVNIIDSMPSVVVGVDTEGKVTQWNKEAQHVTGIPYDLAMGQPLDKTFPLLTTQMEKVYEAMRTRKVTSRPRQVRKENGEVHYEDISIPSSLTVWKVQ
jgi:PAS domain S-box-containing protein